MTMCLPDQLAEMTRTAELVYRILRDDLDGCADAGRVASEMATNISRKQARRLLNELASVGLVETTPDPNNPRQKLFEIPEETTDD